MSAWGPSGLGCQLTAPGLMVLCLYYCLCGCSPCIYSTLCSCVKFPSRFQYVCVWSPVMDCCPIYCVSPPETLTRIKELLN